MVEPTSLIAGGAAVGGIAAVAKTKAAATLVERACDAVGGLFQPWQIKRIARAEVEADLIRAEGQIQVTELHRRAVHRFIEEQAAQQANMEAITEKALPLLEEDTAKPEEIDNDWLVNFYDKSRIVGDEQMQLLWARLLAQEANQPSSFSRRTVNIVADLGKRDAELFANICNFVWDVGDLQPVIFDPNEEMFAPFGINFMAMTNMESFGLVTHDSLGYYGYNAGKTLPVFHQGAAYTLVGANVKSKIPMGKVMFTRAGSELYRLCRPILVLGYREAVIQHWNRNGFKITELPR